MRMSINAALVVALALRDTAVSAAVGATGLPIVDTEVEATPVRPGCTAALTGGSPSTAAGVRHAATRVADGTTATSTAAVLPGCTTVPTAAVMASAAAVLPGCTTGSTPASVLR